MMSYCAISATIKNAQYFSEESVLEHSTPSAFCSAVLEFIFIITWNLPTTSLNRLLSSGLADKGLKLPWTTNPKSLPNLQMKSFIARCG